MGQHGLKIILLFFLVTSAYPPVSIADWIVNPNIQNEVTGATIVAHNANSQGYTLEVYKDADQVIRVRFSLQDGLTSLQAGLALFREVGLSHLRCLVL